MFNCCACWEQNPNICFENDDGSLGDGSNHRINWTRLKSVVATKQKSRLLQAVRPKKDYDKIELLR